MYFAFKNIHYIMMSSYIIPGIIDFFIDIIQVLKVLFAVNKNLEIYHLKVQLVLNRDFQIFWSVWFCCDIFFNCVQILKSSPLETIRIILIQDDCVSSKYSNDQQGNKLHIGNECDRFESGKKNYLLSFCKLWWLLFYFLRRHPEFLFNIIIKTKAFT